MAISLQLRDSCGCYDKGGSRTFIQGGVKDYMCAPEVPYGRGPGPAFKRALESLGVFDALSCYLSLIFKHSDTKLDYKTHNQSNFRGCAPVAPPSKSATGNGVVVAVTWSTFRSFFLAKFALHGSYGTDLFECNVMHVSVGYKNFWGIVVHPIITILTDFAVPPRPALSACTDVVVT